MKNSHRPLRGNLGQEDLLPKVKTVGDGAHPAQWLPLQKAPQHVVRLEDGAEHQGGEQDRLPYEDTRHVERLDHQKYGHNRKPYLGEANPLDISLDRRKADGGNASPHQRVHLGIRARQQIRRNEDSRK